MTDGAGSAGAGNPGGGAAGGNGEGGAAGGNTPFYDGFSNAELKGWVQNKGFENPERLAESYLNLEKLMGHDKAGRTVVLPKDDATPEERAAFFAKLGRPDKPEGYEMPKDGDADFAKWAQGTFHELGLTPAQAKGLVEKWGQFHTGVAETQTAAQTARFTEETNALKKEWGAAFDDKCKIVDRACTEFGFTQDDLTAMRGYFGPAKAMKLLESIGSRLGEAGYVDGERKHGFDGAMTPAQAQAKIQELRGDTGFIAKYTSGDTEARAKMEQLHKWAYPEA